MKTFDEIREGYASAAQRKAIWANKADGGKGHPDNKKEAKSADVKPEKYIGPDGKTKIRMVPTQREDSDAVKAFLAKGGKIKKLPPAKAQGYHGKDDPGKDVAGIMDRPDTKQIGTRKKVKSMGEGTIDEASPKQVKMAVGVASDKRYAGGNMTGAVKVIDKIKPGLSKHPQVAAVLKRQNEAKVDEISKKTAAAYTKKAVNDVDNRSFAQGVRDNNPTYTDGDAKNNRKIANRRKGIDRAVNKMATELTHDTMNKYYDKAKKSKDKATNSAVATIMRKGDHSQDLKTRAKRVKGMELAKTRSLKKIRGDK